MEKSKFESFGVIVFGAGLNGLKAMQDARKKGADKVVIKNGYAELYRIKK